MHTLIRTSNHMDGGGGGETDRHRQTVTDRHTDRQTDRQRECFTGTENSIIVTHMAEC